MSNQLRFVKERRSCNKCVIDPGKCSSNDERISPCADVRKRVGDGHFEFAVSKARTDQLS